jgi:cytochrome oxidase Cu insertion factor (SCO1/SenC/PrrC family)
LNPKAVGGEGPVTLFFSALLNKILKKEVISMRTFLRTLLWAALLLPFVAAPAAAAGPVSIGQKAPTFTGKDANGKTFDLASYRGKQNLILVFYRGYF